MIFKALTCLSFLSASFAFAQLPSSGTETVHSVAHVRAGSEAKYLRLNEKAWTLYKERGLVLNKPHVVLRGTDEKGRTFFVDIFTWKSADIPDHAPEEVKAIWKQLESVCEVRDGRPGIDFSEVTVIHLE